jgi:predicted nucleic acid-binding protein
VTLIDAYGLVALVADEEAASEVEALLRTTECRIVAMNLAETVDICQRVHDIPPGDVRGALEPLTLSGKLAVAVSGEQEAWVAAGLRNTHYHRKDCPLSLADCFLLAHALADGDELATADPDLARVARLEGARVIPLPDRTGKRP